MSSERDDHRGCADGFCGQCDGAGDLECTCERCGDDHWRDCDHCKGTGKCDVNGRTESQEDALQAWHDFVSSIAYPPTPAGFTVAYRQMFSVDPPETLVQAFESQVKALASAADVSPNSIMWLRGMKIGGDDDRR